MSALLLCLLATAVYAVEVDYSETATLADGTVVPIYDSEGTPLIWYVSGTDADGNKLYSSVPNNRNEANGSNDTYVTYTINKGYKTQLENINYHIYNGTDYEVYTEESLETVVVNLRGLTDFIYIHKGFKCSDIQYVYFNETLYDFCDYFKGSTALRLVDLSVCTSLEGGLGGVRNFYNCTNLHTVRLAPEVAYSLKCNANNNWRFSGTAIVEIVIPENVTGLGVDNFKNCTLLESIFILGNTTSLGQRNFLGCTNLTNVYILGNDPQIDIVSFAENFYQCEDGGKILDFNSIGKYFYFATANEEYLVAVMEAIGASAIVSYDDFVSNPEAYTEGRYVISGTNVCDVYYGEHVTNPENIHPCVDICEVCGKAFLLESPAHILNTTAEYDSYLEGGKIITACTNEGCTYVAEEAIPALFECMGVSVKTFGDDLGITQGYYVNRAAIETYKAYSSDFDFGVLVCANADGTAMSPVPNGDKVVDVVFDKMANDYVEIKVTGIPREYESIPVVLCIYVFEKGAYSYVDNGVVSDTVIGTACNTVS